MKKIALFSVPRSGSTWLGQILNSHPNVLYKFQPNFAYSFEYSLNEYSSSKEIENFYENLKLTKDSFVNAEISISSQKGLKFKKDELKALVFKETHYINVLENLIQKSDTKIIGLIRSPFSVINSWLTVPKEFDPDWDIKSEWLNAPRKNENKKFNFFGFNKWKEATFLFLKLQKEYPEQLLVVSYDELLKDTEVELEKLFAFCELPPSNQTYEFLKLSTQTEDNDPYSVFRRKTMDNKWEQTLPEFIIEEIKKDKEFQKLNEAFKWI